MMDLVQSLYPLYRLGLMVCGAVGYNNTHGKWASPIIWAACLGGGATRDIAFHWTLACLSVTAIPDICAAWLGALFQALWGYKRIFRACLFLCDSFAVATFAILGVSAAQNHGCGPFCAFVAGSVTALFGGVLSAMWAGQRIRDILRENISYRLIAMVAAAFYTSWIYGGADPSDAQNSVVLLAGISNLMACKGFWGVVQRLAQQQTLLMPVPEHTVILMRLQLGRHWVYVPHRAVKESMPYQKAWHRSRYHCIQPA